MGDLLFKIRFPTMEPSEFARLTGGKNLLTLEEKESVYYILSTMNKDFLVIFPTESRSGEEVWVDRTVSCATGQYIYDTKAADAIDFKVDQDIVLTGIGLYKGYNRSGNDVDIEVCSLKTPTLRSGLLCHIQEVQLQSRYLWINKSLLRLELFIP